MSERRRPPRKRGPRSRFHVVAGWLRQWLAHTWLGCGVLAAACGIALVAALWYGMPAGWQWVRSHPYFALAHIELEGNRRLSRHDVLEWVGVGEGTSSWEAAPGTVEARLEGHPWIRRATVQRDFPRRLTITVEERRPVAIVRLDALHYVDRAGHVLGPLRADDSRDFPVITGFEEERTRGFAPLGIYRALQLLRRCERLNCFDGVSEVHVDQQQGVTIYPLRPAVAVVLGWGNWRQKLTRSARVLAVWEGQTRRLATVDVSFRELVVVKRRVERQPAAVRSPRPAIRV